MIHGEELRRITAEGHDPIWVRDVQEGDEIIISHQHGEWNATQMTVTGLRTSPSEMRSWVGVLACGEGRVHCCYQGAYECWRVKKETVQKSARFTKGDIAYRVEVEALRDRDEWVDSNGPWDTVDEARRWIAAMWTIESAGAGARKRRRIIKVTTAECVTEEVVA